MNLLVRRAQPEDLPGILAVESLSTPGLRYLGPTFSEFASDSHGELSVAVLDGEVAGVGKFTVLPDGSAWLEALRVPPVHQGKGIGKKFYERFFELAGEKDISTMRMYTNIGNSASKGLAERFGFQLAGTFRGMGLAVADLAIETQLAGFMPVTDGERGARLLLAHRSQTNGFVIMNRTFYEVTAALGDAWAREGKLFEERRSGSIIALGARFLPEQAVHIAMMSGDRQSCLSFARAKALERKAARIQYMIPADAAGEQEFLASYGLTPDPYDCIVMEIKLR